MAQIATFKKDPDARLDYVIDWAAALQDANGDQVDFIVGSAWAVDDPALTIESSPFAPSFTATTTTVWLSGGVAGTDYAVTNRITTDDGRIDDRTIRIKVQER